MRSLLICRLLFVSVFIALTSSECVEKSFGHLRTVCVCSEKSCDSVGPTVEPQEGQAVLYYSSESGKRFERQVISGKSSAWSALGSHSIGRLISRIVEFSLRLGSSVSTRYQEKDSIPVVVDTKRTFQTIHGFGGAFTDAAGINIRKLPEELQNRLIEDYFGKTGIEYTLCRVPISSTDFSARVYTYDDIPGDSELRNFSLAEEDHIYKIPYIKQAMKLTNDQLRLISSQWSPPAWMKDNNKLTDGGFLLPQHQQTMANYFVRFFEEYQKQGISFWATTVNNEPRIGPAVWKWQRMNYTAAQERDLVKNYLGPTLRNNALTKNITILGSDDQTFEMDLWTNTLLEDEEAAQYYGGIAVHWYKNEEHEFTEVLNRVHQQHPDKFVINTEACVTGPTPGNWTGAVLYASDIIDNLNNFVTGWLDWNLVLDMQGGPNWVDNFVDAPILVDAEKNEYYKQPTYYAMGHFSKFVRPGSHHVYSNVTRHNNKVQAVAFKVPNGNTVVILHNKDEKFPHTFSVSDVSKRNVEYHVDMEPRSLATLIF